MADAVTSAPPKTAAPAAEADATTLDELLREQAADNACGEVYTLAQAIAAEPPPPDGSVVVVGGAVAKMEAALVRGPGHEAKVGAALRAWAPWLDAALALGAHVAGGAVARAVCNAEHRCRPKDVDIFAADPAAVADALGAAVEAAFRGAPREPAGAGVVEVLRVDTPHATTWVPEVAGRRLMYRDAGGCVAPYPVAQLVRLPCASLAACLGSFDLAPCQAAWTADGLRFSAAGASHYRRGYSLVDPSRAGAHYLVRLYKYHNFTSFAVPVGTTAVRVGPCELTIVHQKDPDRVCFGDMVAVDPAAPAAGPRSGSVYELGHEREYASASLADLEADNAKALREGRPGGVARFEGWDRFERLAARIAAAASRSDHGPAAAFGVDLPPRLAGAPAADLGAAVAELLRAEMGRLAAALPAEPPTAELFARRPTTAAEMFVRS